jgi:hypothetical protein
MGAMNRRGKGVAHLAACVGLIVLVSAGIVGKDRFWEEWSLVSYETPDLVRKVERISPKSVHRGETDTIYPGAIEVKEFLEFLADETGLPVLVDRASIAPAERPSKGLRKKWDPGPESPSIEFLKRITGVTPKVVASILRANGYLVTRRVLTNGEMVWLVIASNRI